MTQSRGVYITGDAVIDRILNDISERLDTIEGLRPDLDAGYYSLDSEKDISTEDIAETYQRKVDNVSIDTGSVTVTSSAGNSIYVSGAYIEIKDQDGTIIHKFGSWT